MSEGRPKTSSYVKILAFAAVLALLGAVKVHFAEVLQKRSFELTSQIKLKQRLIAREADLLKHKGEIERTSRDHREKFASTLTEDQESALFLNELEQLARASSISLLDFKVSPPLKKDYVTEYRVAVSVESSNMKLMEFFLGIESLPGFLHVSEFHSRVKESNTSLLETRLIISKCYVH